MRRSPPAAAANLIADALPDVAQNQEVDLLNLSNNGVPNVGAVPKEPSFDLLGSFEMAEAQGNNAMPDLLSNSQTKLPGLDDIFGSFNVAAAAQSNSNGNTGPLPDLNNLNFNAFGGVQAPAAAAAADPFDLAANLNHAVNNVPLLPTSTDASPQQAPPAAPANNATNKDPFGDLGNLATGLNLNWGNAPTMKPSPMNSAHSTQASSPTHQFGAFATASNSANLSATTSPRAPSTPTHPQAAPGAAAASTAGNRPDYSRSNFEPKTKPAAGASNGAAATGGADIFADILGQQGYNFASKSSQGPRTINAMRKEELVKDMDPDKLRILEWVSNSTWR